jgi:ankyrin repeat protein
MTAMLALIILAVFLIDVVFLCQYTSLGLYVQASCVPGRPLSCASSRALLSPLGETSRTRPTDGSHRRLAYVSRLRGGQIAEAPGGDIEVSAKDDEEQSSCEWFKAPKTTNDGPVPRLDSDHAPWLDAYRQVYFECKLHNRSQVRAYQNCGHPPPRCVRTVNVSDDPLAFYDHQAEDQPLCESWEQYWAEWDEEWAQPPDGGSDIAQQRYKMPYLTDQVPALGLSRISVDERVMFTSALFPDSIPQGWPEALYDVLHDRYDEVKRVMDLNLRLLEAAHCGDIEAAVQLLREGALVHAGDSNNQFMTPLHHAAYGGHVELIHVLVSEEGADVDRTTLGGETALHKAVQGQQADAVQALLDLGADPNVRSGLTGCPQGGQPGMGWTPMFRASLLGLTGVVRMLAARGGEVDVVSTIGWTPLHYAAVWAHNDTVAALLELGADPLVQTKHGGHTAYDRAMMSRFSPDTPSRPMRQLYKSVIEHLTQAMRRALNGRDPVCSLPPHFRHGQMSADEVRAEHEEKWRKFYDGSWVREWRRLNGLEAYAPSRDELLDVMRSWLDRTGFPVPRLQALRGGGDEELWARARRPLRGGGDGLEEGTEVEGVGGEENAAAAAAAAGRGAERDNVILSAADLNAIVGKARAGGQGRVGGGGGGVLDNQEQVRVLGAKLAQLRVVVGNRSSAVAVLRDVLGMQVQCTASLCVSVLSGCGCCSCGGTSFLLSCASL